MLRIKVYIHIAPFLKFPLSDSSSEVLIIQILQSIDLAGAGQQF